jgi:hypothetical protein
MAPLTSDDSPATRREFDLMISRIEGLDRSLDSIDRDGTRGVMALQAQLTDTIKDITELKTELHSFKGETSRWFEKHSNQHQQDMRDRTSGRRWMIGTAIAGMLAMAAVLTLLVQVLQNVHK